MSIYDEEYDGVMAFAMIGIAMIVVFVLMPSAMIWATNGYTAHFKEESFCEEKFNEEYSHIDLEVDTITKGFYGNCFVKFKGLYRNTQFSDLERQSS